MFNKIYTLLICLFLTANLSAQSIFDIVAGSDVHNTLETAIIQAELDGALSAPGTLTLFAPTDAAFDALPEGALEAVLADNELLTAILTYHALGSTVLSTDLVNNTSTTTLSTRDIIIRLEGGNVFINNAQVTLADIPADNGVVHVVDAVILPSNSVFDVVVNSDVHTTLEVAIFAADLDETLQGAGSFTLFAPTDAAFAALPEGTLEAVLADNDLLTAILTYHALGATVLSTDLSNNLTTSTLNGQDIIVRLDGGNVFINDAQVVLADIAADNGVVHVLDAVLLPSNSVFDIVVNSDVHTTLETAIFAADLDETLQGDGTFTLFAPTDAAFAALPEGTLEAVLADTDLLTSILTYHALGSTVVSTDLANNITTSTLNGQDIIVRLEGGGVFINDAEVTIADIAADNGVVHVIDAVLLPANSIFDIVVNSDVHTTLETAIFAADLDETLQGDGTFTLFAPTDEAFAALPEGTLEAVLADTDLLTSILTYHALGSTVLSTDLANNITTSTLNGQDIIVRLEGGSVFINDAEVTIADIAADNGVVHVIDAVLLPANSIFDIVVNSDVHTTLETAIFAADLDETLQGDGTFTLFAPTDEAFAALPEGTLEAVLADTDLLTSILTYHALGSTVLSTDLANNITTSTLNGQDIIVRLEGGGVFINDAEVTIADIAADNGVVHVIDAVLLPANSIFDIVVNSDVHTTLETAIFAANLDETLQGDGTFTLFAPTDDAFAALPAGTLDALLADPTGILAQTLLFHAVGSTAFAADLSDGQVLTTLDAAGNTVTVSIDGGNVFINNAQVIIADIAADNGVVHVVDAVIGMMTNTIDLQNTDVAISVYPNPASSYISIENADLSANYTGRLIDVMGREITRFVVNGASLETIDLTNVAQGVYFVELRDATNIYQQQVIVQK